VPRGICSTEIHMCRADLVLEHTNGSAMLGTAAVLPLFGWRADAAFLMYHRRRTAMACRHQEWSELTTNIFQKRHRNCLPDPTNLKTQPASQFCPNLILTRNLHRHDSRTGFQKNQLNLCREGDLAHVSDGWVASHGARLNNELMLRNTEKQQLVRASQNGNAM
jgi:hypothetical protein